MGIGSFVKAIYSLPEWGDNLVFKGGTCLHKCYIENYRFSEDLDFTVVSEKFELTMDLLELLCKQIFKQAAIQTHIEYLETLIFENKPTGYAAKVKFWGADHSRSQTPPSPERWATSIKIEIIQYEIMIFPTESKGIMHPYSDMAIVGDTKAICYSIEEVIAEKLRALIQRKYTAPRDYFDIWYLVNHNEHLNWVNIKEAFVKKVKFKKLEYNSPEDLLTEETIKLLNKHWGNTLKHQLRPELYVEPDVVIDYCKLLFSNNL